MATATASGDGAANAVTFITGTTATEMRWPANSIPATFTVCSVTRYTGGARGRILSCDLFMGVNWFHGHYFPSKRGQAYYKGWRTANAGSIGVLDDWLVMCGTNAGATVPGNIILDQDEIGTIIGGTGGCPLSINGLLDPGYSEPSDWALHSVLIWDYSLGTAPVPFHATPLPQHPTHPTHCACRRESFHGTVQCSLHPVSQGWVTGDGQRYACNPEDRRNSRALTRPGNPPMARERFDPTFDTSVTDCSCKPSLAGTADMKRATAALREVNPPGSTPTCTHTHALFLFFLSLSRSSRAACGHFKLLFLHLQPGA